MKLRVPPDLAAGDELYLTTIMVIRAHLPMGFLDRSHLPLLIDPDGREPTMILPALFWPRTLVDT